MICLIVCACVAKDSWTHLRWLPLDIPGEVKSTQDEYYVHPPSGIDTPRGLVWFTVSSLPHLYHFPDKFSEELLDPG